ncbi:hypothetical protein L249_4044 [Ophiocordyceps polyrhachis-furcata BCC 54312]|uniref:Uncharacterized protein n=1 Tax=Ophiocordyceps polyrhachis-furcata BCC 54312 TaxID=1330021 RepID=A0A367L560_9HYPO|nr:hypothetical protein L249_4044 [Ophiocordyceps polyrhachis-furcata BCC 54312]
MASSSHLLRSLVTFLWGLRQENALWQAMLKFLIAIIAAVALAFLPAFRNSTSFLIPMAVCFAHPGQRMGRMIQSLLMVLVGAIIGLSWSLLGIRLAFLVEGRNPAAANAIRALFFLFLLLVHGYIRSSNPGLMIFVMFLIIPATLTIQLPGNVTGSIYTTTYIPLLLGAAVLLIVNIALFPELSSTYLGSTTIDALSETVDTLTRATIWFVTPGCDPESAPTETSSPSKPGPPVKNRAVAKFFSQFPNPFHPAKHGSALSSLPHQNTKLVHLTAQKPNLRACLARCRGVQDEVNFELSLSPLPPTALKPITIQYMAGLVRNVTTLIGACENKFVVVGTNESFSSGGKEESSGIKGRRKSAAKSGNTSNKSRVAKPDPAKPFPSVKPTKEIETSSAELLEAILTRIRGPAQDFQVSVAEAANLVILCLAYCFDVPKLPSGAAAPRTMSLQEIDVRIDRFSRALTLFDTQAADQLKQTMMDKSCEPIDFMPGMETFMASSFILSLRDSAAQLLEMLRHLRFLVESRQRRRNRSRLWVPHLTRFWQWIAKKRPAKAVELTEVSDGPQRPAGRDAFGSASAMSESNFNQIADEENRIGQTVQWADLKVPSTMRPSKKQLRRKSELKNLGLIAKTREKAADALEWAQSSKDLDYALKLAVATFLLLWPAFVTSWRPWYTQVRGIWAPVQLVLVFEISIGSSAFAALLLIPILPSIYIQVATKYVKVAIVSIISMTVVALASVNGNIPAYEIFYKRLVAFLIGGLVAMLVEVVIAPVRARDRLVECLSYSVRQIQKMEKTLSVGIDGPWSPNIRSQSLLSRFKRARDKAQGALAEAETTLPFCLSEPRLKGSFKPLAPIYAEIIYVLHQIIDRMDNVVQLRRTYGSSILEDLNPKVYAYRRNVAASTTLILCSVNEALTTWLPLPQFLPSARLALLRLISRVREIVASDNNADQSGEAGGRTELDEETASLITKRKFLSWNAGTVGQMEIIEYLEELAELVKLLVGVNAFKSGMLKRSTEEKKFSVKQALATDAVAASSAAATAAAENGGDDKHQGVTPSTTVEDEAYDSEAISDGENWDEGIPLSLQRVGTRLRRDSSVVRRRTICTIGTR